MKPWEEKVLGFYNWVFGIFAIFAALFFGCCLILLFIYGLHQSVWGTLGITAWSLFIMPYLWICLRPRPRERLYVVKNIKRKYE